MNLNNQILEAIQRGINLAIDDFDDIQDVEIQKVGLVENKFSTAELIELRKHFVDLGLPSGTLWAKYNVGVDPIKLNKPEDWYGGYYAWGEIKEKQNYNWTTYKYTNRDNELTKYCAKDNLTTLQDENDAAAQTNNLPWTVNMPTKELIEELIEYTTNKWVKNYQGITGLNGRIFTSKRNGNKIFIPAAGYRAGSSVSYVGSSCNLWSCSLHLAAPNIAYFLFFYSAGCNICNDDRYYGCNVRPVLVQ